MKKITIDKSQLYAILIAFEDGTIIHDLRATGKAIHRKLNRMKKRELDGCKVAFFKLAEVGTVAKLAI